MEAMRWSEILPSGGNNGNNNNDPNNGNHHNHHHDDDNNNNGNHNPRGGGGPVGAPTIKNHSVTHFGDYLYCFGGYDGRRNHLTLLLYSIKEKLWIRPHHVGMRANNNPNPNPHPVVVVRRHHGHNQHQHQHGGRGGGGNNNNEMDQLPPLLNRHAAVVVPNDNDDDDDDDDDHNDDHNEEAQNDNNGGAGGGGGGGGGNDNDDDDGHDVNNEVPLGFAMGAFFRGDPVGHGGNNHPLPPLRAPGGDGGHGHGGGGGGGDGDEHFIPRGDSMVLVTGSAPPGRNGHSATLAIDPDDNDCARIVIIGGWLGTGPLAASDMHVLHICNNSRDSDDDDNNNNNNNNNGDDSDEDTVAMANFANVAMRVDGASNAAARGERRRQHRLVRRQQRALMQADRIPPRPTLRWSCPAVRGTPPGPCNMHSADFVKRRQEVYVFRGGNGREYLNDLHALSTNNFHWRRVETTGEVPQQRANHSSAILDETGELFVFGGWNGTERLNDIHILDTETSNWTRPHIGGVLPHPRAGMTLTALRGRLYLFGGSGTSSKCFQDLQILDRDQMAWLDVTPYEPAAHGRYQAQPRHQVVRDNPDEGDMPDFHFGGDRSNPNMMDVDMVGGGNSEHQPGAFTSSLHADWRSREMAVRPRSGGVIGSANPNDEDTIPTVLLHGRAPGRRAGHTATAVGAQIYVFGGSCGSDYLNDFFVLDSDPAPQAIVTEPTSLHLVERRLRHFFNDEEFSDVVFLVQGRRVYGHKMVLAIVSDCFRAMFTAGFRESSSPEIEITDCSYDGFLAVMDYIYTGAYPEAISTQPPSVLEMMTPQQRQRYHQQHQQQIIRIVDILELADRFMLDHLKQVCERVVQSTVTEETLEYMMQVAQKANAMQLLAVCEHFARNHEI